RLGAAGAGDVAVQRVGNAGQDECAERPAGAVVDEQRHEDRDEEDPDDGEPVGEPHVDPSRSPGSSRESPKALGLPRAFGVRPSRFPETFPRYGPTSTSSNVPMPESVMPTFLAPLGTLNVARSVFVSPGWSRPPVMPSALIKAAVSPVS